MFHVGEYVKARDKYQQMLQDELQPWERAIILYDLGSVLLAQKQFEQAIKIFQQVPLDNSLGPVLNYRSKYDIVYGIYLQGMAEAQQHKYREAKQLLYQALVEINTVKEAHCFLEKAKGDENCNEAGEIEDLEAAIYKQIALTLVQEKEFSIDSLQLKEGVELLINGVERSLEEVKFLSDNKLKGDLRKKYVDYFSEEQLRWKKAWDKVEEVILNHPTEEKTKLFNAAKEAYLQGFEEIKSDHLETASEAFQKADDALKELLKLASKSKAEKDQQQENREPEQSKSQEQMQKPLENMQPGQEQKNKKIEQVLKNLLEMAQDDMEPKVEQRATKKELRPW